MYPENDNEFTDEAITSVERNKDGTFTIGCDGWLLWCGKDCATEPKPGQMSRKYGKGIGARVRGLFIDGQKIWYRTESEDEEHSEIELYGADAADWLARWDRGDLCHTIEMGGLGPGYEQAIHIAAAEILRWFVTNKPDHTLWQDGDVWKSVRNEMDKAVSASKVISDIGLSGAQWGAAVSVASALYMQGPRGVMNDKRVKDRHIMVSKNFPRAA